MKNKNRISLVKKNIEWLRDEINELPLMFVGFSVLKQREEFAVDRDDVMELINQLDEPEVKQLERKIKELESFNDELIRDNNQLRNALDNQEVLSQELPVIPSYVAKWIAEVKKQDKSLVFAIAHIYDKNAMGETPSEEENRIFRWMELDDNEEVFARAWLDGYTVEKEQKYRLKLNGDYLSRAQIDYEADKGNTMEVTIHVDVNGFPYNFSEDEKSYVEKYLNVEVEELEE